MTGLPMVAVLHAPGGAATVPEIVRAARGVCRIQFVFRADVAAVNPRLVRLAAQLGGATVLDHDGKLPAGFTADTCLTFTDSQVDHADAAAAQLRGGVPRAVGAWDKLVQRRALRSAGLTALDVLPVDTAADLAAAADDLGFPFVIKPRRGVGGRGVRIIHDARALTSIARSASLAHHLAESWHADGHHPAEDPLLADFVSVETVSTGGVHRPVAIFDKLPVTFTDEPGLPGARVTGDLYPTRLPDQTRHDVMHLVAGGLTALNVTDRLTHTEVKLSPHGPEVIEVNGRMGGDLMRLLAVAAGPDLVRAALLASVGMAEPAEPATSGPAAAGVYPGFAEGTGMVASEVSRSTVLRLPDVVRVDHVAERGRPRTDAGGRAVDVVVAAPDVAEIGLAVARTAVALTELFAHDQLAPRRWLASCTEMFARHESLLTAAPAE